VAGRAQTSAVLCEGLGGQNENILLKALDFIFKGRLVELCFINKPCQRPLKIKYRGSL
jgi:hypothetical protein